MRLKRARERCCTPSKTQTRYSRAIVAFTTIKISRKEVILGQTTLRCLEAFQTCQTAQQTTKTQYKTLNTQSKIHRSWMGIMRNFKPRPRSRVRWQSLEHVCLTRMLTGKRLQPTLGARSRKTLLPSRGRSSHLIISSTRAKQRVTHPSVASPSKMIK
jgi:hypothetical protein